MAIFMQYFLPRIYFDPENAGNSGSLWMVSPTRKTANFPASTLVAHYTSLDAPKGLGEGRGMYGGTETQETKSSMQKVVSKEIADYIS